MYAPLCSAGDRRTILERKVSRRRGRGTGGVQKCYFGLKEKVHRVKKKKIQNKQQQKRYIIIYIYIYIYVNGGSVVATCCTL